MQQMSQCLFITLSWKLVSASHRLVLPVSTCSLVLALVRTGPPHEVGLKPDAQKLLRSDCYSCKWLQCFSLFGRWEGGCEEEEEEREREREREREEGGDKLQASTLEQPHSTGPTMEFRGACVLLGVLLLVNCSLQQTPVKRKPVKKGRKQQNVEGIQMMWMLCFCYELFHISQISFSCFTLILCSNIWLTQFDFPPVFGDSDTSKDAAVEQLQKQIDDIVQELNLLKEQQALQTGEPDMCIVM